MNPMKNKVATAATISFFPFAAAGWAFKDDPLHCSVLGLVGATIVYACATLIGRVSMTVLADGQAESDRASATSASATDPPDGPENAASENAGAQARSGEQYAGDAEPATPPADPAHPQQHSDPAQHPEPTVNHGPAPDDGRTEVEEKPDHE